MPAYLLYMGSRFLQTMGQQCLDCRLCLPRCCARIGGDCIKFSRNLYLLHLDRPHRLATYVTEVM